MVLEVSTSEVYDAFGDVAKVSFTKETVERVKTKPSFFAAGDSKSLMFQQRYNMILQQLFRDSKFIDTARGKRGADFPMISFFGSAAATQQPAVNSHSLLSIHSSDENAGSWRFELTPVESLPGSTGVKVVFGLLCLIENGKYVLEDIHQAVPVKLESVMSTNDFITNNTFVLAKGEMFHDVFNISELTIPPVPNRTLCEATVNLFGGPIEMTNELVINTVGLAPEDSSIAVLAGLHLDDPACIDRLNMLVTGFEECESIPSAYVFVGDFVTKKFNPYSGDSVRATQKSFEALSQLLARHPRTLEASHIVLVPGPGDAGNGLLPQPPFSDALVRGLSSRFPNFVLASNPCRIRYFDKQILVFAGENLKRIRKARIVHSAQEEAGDDGDTLSRYILSQMHLVPGPVADHAVAWDFDAGLRVYPPPHAIFLSDPDVEGFTKDFHGETTAIGLPAFVTNSGIVGDFHLYSPSCNSSTLSSV